MTEIKTYYQRRAEYEQWCALQQQGTQVPSFETWVRDTKRYYI